VAQPDELVDVELVVGEEHEVLEVLGHRARVVAQAVQRVVHARRGEQRQRLGFAGLVSCVPLAMPSSIAPGPAGRTGRAAAAAARPACEPSRWSFSASEKCTGIGDELVPTSRFTPWFFSSRRNCSA
jgi:hypothetical protein